jgi:Extracellular link domain
MMMNTSASPPANPFGSLPTNASKVGTAVANSTIKAANSLSTAAVGSTSTLADSLTHVANSVTTAANAVTSTLPSVPSFNSLTPIGTTGSTNSSTTSTFGSSNNSSVFKNVNAANINSTITSGLNSATSTMNSVTSSLPSWAWPVGIFLFIAAIFLMIFVFFKNEVTLAYNNMVRYIRHMFGYEDTTPPVVNDEKHNVTGGPLSAEEELEKKEHDKKSLIEKVLPLGASEVFNVSSNDYTYYDAEPLCMALGAELATYDQVQDAWKKGADWCNYGWVKGQVAVYPTQKETWDKLQHGPEDEKFACGNPGVNGGFFDNPEMRFGVNCYGSKPSQSSNDEKVLMANGSVPKTPAALKIDQQVQEYKAEMGHIGVLPFSGKTWTSG